nr:peptidylprolyl isomerase [uncultured Carboxylicivirga sp.]
MKLVTTLFIGCCILFFSGCDMEIEKGVKKSDLSKDVELITDYGTIIFRLSDETPKHRNNFIKLINQKAYDNVSFHRVIENFLIQTGDMATKYPESKIQDSTSEPSYMIDAEIKSNLFHKRGAINAARIGDDQNPGRSSDGTQFTIIQGKIYNDSTLAIAEKRINNWLAYNNVINKPEHKTEFDKLFKLTNKLEAIQTSENDTDSVSLKIMEDSINQLKNKFDSLAQTELKTMEHYHFPESHREIYKTIGGAAHLDQNYTVFGEVVKGMDIVDRIASVETDHQDKPINDVKIISAKMIERKTY